MTTHIARLTISLPQELAQLAGEIAKERKTSRSNVISSCLEELAKKRFRSQMEEGYKAVARENLEFASRAMEMAHEVVPGWK